MARREVLRLDGGDGLLASLDGFTFDDEAWKVGVGQHNSRTAAVLEHDRNEAPGGPALDPASSEAGDDDEMVSLAQVLSPVQRRQRRAASRGVRPRSMGSTRSPTTAARAREQQHHHHKDPCAGGRHVDGAEDEQDGGEIEGVSAHLLRSRLTARREMPAIAETLAGILDQHGGHMRAARLGAKLAKVDSTLLRRAKALCGGLVSLLENFPDRFYLTYDAPHVDVFTVAAATQAEEDGDRRQVTRAAVEEAARVAAALSDRHSVPSTG